LKTKEKMIDGKSVSITALGFFEQMELKRKMVTPAMEALLPLLAGGQESEVDFTKIESILGNLSEVELKRFIKMVLGRCHVDGSDMSDELSVDEMLASHTVLFYKIVGFFLEVNYSDFLELIRGILEKAGISMEGIQEKLTVSSKTTKKSS